MAANKFATMMHRNTNKIMLILTYTVLEWILILLLLLNSLFSYLILKFADYFGLPRPCLWCSRLDQLFDSSKAAIHYRDLVCHDHAGEISNLGFCSNHRKLVEFQDLCEECSPSLPSHSGIVDSSETPVTCSCCGLSVERKLKSLSSTGDLATEEAEAEGGATVADGIGSDVLGDHMEEEFGEFMVSDGGCEEVKELRPCPCPSAESGFIEMVTVTDEDEKLVMVMEVENQKEEENRPLLPADDGSKKNEVAAASAPHLEFFIGDDECELIPVEWVVSTKGRKQHKLSSTVEEDDGGSEDVIMDFCCSAKPRRSSRRKKAATLFPIQESDEEHYTEHIAEAAVEADSADGGEQFDYPHKDNKLDNVQKLAEGDAVKEEDEHFPSARTVEIENVLEEAVDGDSTKEVDREDDNIAQADEIDNVQEAFEADSLKEGDEHFPTSQTIENVVEMVEPNPNEEGNKQDGIGVAADVSEHVNVLQETAVHEVEANISPAEERYDRKSDDFNAGVSIGEEIPNHELIDDIHTQDAGSSISPEVFPLGNNDHGNEDDVQVEEGNLEFKVISIEQSEDAANNKVDVEDSCFPVAPTLNDSLQRKLEKRDSMMSEDSLDGGSVTSEIENGEGPVTMEALKSALKAERKALNALYAELEEERNASAVAASQTMAMINRLQEEKATMQMEALQYQRMMEEQAEYDQEALQLLNDLMVKRETEKQELEKELEVYRNKVEEFEAKEKIEMLLRGKDKEGEEEDSEGFSDEPKEEDPHNNNTPSDAILYLEDSLANFEEERNSILDQLKVLEQKLILSEDSKENGNGHYAMNEKHYKQGRFMGPKAKTLLPLFNANATGEEHDEDWLQKTPPGIEMEDYKVDTEEEEVDQLYERLQVLETDREFLKHCISSLKKGDKGLPILQEILQHLRDLRSIELHGQEIMDGVIA